MYTLRNPLFHISIRESLWNPSGIHPENPPGALPELLRDGLVPCGGLLASQGCGLHQIAGMSRALGQVAGDGEEDPLEIFGINIRDGNKDSVRDPNKQKHILSYFKHI